MGRRYGWRHAVAIAVVVTAVWLMVGWILGPRVLSVVIEEESEVYGILTLHGIVVTNRSPWPVRITECQWRYSHDPLSLRREPASAVERWDVSTSQWVVFSEYHKEFCGRYPEESFDRSLQRRWLWPTQQIAVPPAVILDPAIRRGDVVRFVVYVAWPDRSRDVIASPMFVIDQCDPYEYRPEGWQPVAGRALLEWTSPEGIELATERLGWCEHIVGASFYLGNTSEHTIVLEHVELLGTGLARRLDEAISGWQTGESIAPGESRRLLLRWSVERRPDDFLGPDPSLVLSFRVGEDVVAIPIAYTPGR